MAINETWKLAPWAAALYACDEDWWRLRAPSVDDFRGLRIVANGEFPGCHSVNVVDDGYHLIWDDDRLGSGGNSAFQAMNLVLRWGASRIILTGVDCGGEHWHGAHEGGLRNPQNNTFDKWIKAFGNAARDLKARGIEVVNCSRQTALECFPRMTIDEALV